jgi:hypothetical protein
LNLAIDLLEQSNHLFRRESKKPRQASLRRSTSTAYYALFHLLCADAVALLAPNVNESARAVIQRAINHDALKQSCGRFLQTPLSAPLAALVGSPISDDLRFVALAFMQLQEARHSADYDLNSNWNRAKASQYVQIAKDAFAAWGGVRRTSEANVFLLSILLMKTLESPR